MSKYTSPDVARVRDSIRSIFVRNKTIIAKKAPATSREVKIVFRGTGGAGAVAQWLLGEPGASSTILSISYPYHRNALSRALGSPPSNGYCSRETSLEIARSSRNEGKRILSEDIKFELFHPCAYGQKSQKHEVSPPIVLGVGFTGVLASDRPHKGEHRGFVGLCDSEGREFIHSLSLEKGLRSRIEEDTLTSYLVVQAIMDYISHYAEEETSATKEKKIPKVSHLQPLYATIQTFGGITHKFEEIVSSSEEAKQLALDSLLQKNRHHAFFWPKSTTDSVLVPYFPAKSLRSSGSTVLILSGSFNPLHVGHEKMALAAIKKYKDIKSGEHDCRLVFELSAHNADKGEINKKDVEKRLLQFTDSSSHTFGPWPVVATMHPKFVEKASLFPGCVFVVGMDTAVRLVDKKYYNDSENEMIQAILEMKNLGCEFIVGGRLNKETEVFETFHEHHQKIPVLIRSMFHILTEDEFRLDLSSTELRQRLKDQSNI